MKYFAIDYGEKRTGIAVSDPHGSLVFPRKTIFVRDKDSFYKELIELIHHENPDAIVIGLPTLIDGSNTLFTRQVYNFAKNLKSRISQQIFLMEELLSSYEAKDMLKTVGYRTSKIKKVLDQQAAVNILESFLHQHEKERKRYEL